MFLCPSFIFQKKKNNPKRFSVLTDEYKASRVVRTIINIMLFIHKNNPIASFAWIGVATSMKNKKEGKSFTQRYRI
jgi:predicted HAD superfamily hydrolase